MARSYITVSIPYVNARPHVGYALELVEADVLARQRRAAGDDVRFLGGTDDHTLKNVLGAEAEGVPTQDFVDANAAAFEALRDPLRDLVRRLHPHQPRPPPRAGVERLWRAAAANGDFYRQLVRGPVLRRVRAVLRGVGARRRLLSGARHAGGDRGARRTGSSGSRGTSSSWSTSSSEGDARDRAGDLPQRGAGVPRRWPRRHQRVALADAGARLGHPGTRRSDAGRSTCGGTRSGTTSPRSTTAPTATRSTRGGARPTSAST